MATLPKPLPDQEHLRRVLDYEPETGDLTWRPTMGNRAGYAGRVAGSVNRLGYRSLRLDGHRYLAHRLIWVWLYGQDPGPLDVDHKDRNPRNNRADNLRLATPSGSARNIGLSRRNTSGFKGVKRKAGRWAASIYRDGRTYHLGYFDTPEEGAAAYRAAAAERDGAFFAAA